MEVTLVDCMPRENLDSAIVQAARVSYGSGTKTPSDDRGLIRYLMRHWHTTPFEMVEFKFRVKCPIFVARQHMRHRTASINEVSARYSLIEDEYYTPSPFRGQSTVNKQGSSDSTIEDLDVYATYVEACEKAFQAYKKLIGAGVARELARCVLPQSTYTEFYWKINLHNLLHYLKLRIHPHAQQEIRELACKFFDIVKEKCPVVAEAFTDYRLDAITLTGPELSGKPITNKREQAEYEEKKKRIC